ncbi:MAG TPA: thioredoxin [Clostridia bacterium]
MTGKEVIDLSKVNFDAEVLRSEVPVILDFWAEWCRPCQIVKPILDELALCYDNKVKICKVNVEEENELSSRFRIISIPTIIIFKEGQMVDRIVGAKSRADFEEIINKYI